MITHICTKCGEVCQLTTVTLKERHYVEDSSMEVEFDEVVSECCFAEVETKETKEKEI